MRARTNSRSFWLLLAALVLAGGIIHIWERAGEAHVARKSFNEFPAQLGTWREVGGDMKFDAETEKVLGADDYVSRNFTSADGRLVSFYAGYYATQRTGATYHSPLNCLPGSGWFMSGGGQITITPSNGSSPFDANRYVVQNGNNRALMVYWYQGRGRAEASEYWAKIHTVVDSVRRRRSDGAMVRVMVPLGDSQKEAERIAVELASQAAAELPAYVPN